MADPLKKSLKIDRSFFCLNKHAHNDECAFANSADKETRV
jgi:hypothetical protein